MRCCAQAFLAAVLLSAVLSLDARAQTPQRSRSRHSQAVTFNNQIVRIFQRDCQICHHPGEVAPFSLMDYQTSKLFAAFIKRSVEDRSMPPWKPVPGIGDFQNTRVLSEHEIELIAQWADGGAPQGNARHLPEPLEFDEEWTLGEPDLVLEMPAYAPDPSGSDDYRCFSLPTETTGGRKVGAIEVRPGNRRIVHHVLLFPDPQGVSAGFGEPGDPKPGYTCFGDAGFDAAGFFGGWAPGNRPQVLPDGVAYSLSAGSRVAMQVHYHPDGTRQQDQTRVGLHFIDDPSATEMFTLPVINQNFVIPAGAENHEVTAEFTTPIGGRVHSVLPHMHLLGREIQLELFFPDGSRRMLIRIDDWDFDWQDTYWLVEPLRVPAGTRVRLTAVYDNSADNPRNPNRPPQPVGWGERTIDEMALAFVGVTID